MTPADLRAALARLGLTQTGAAGRWRVTVRAMQMWCAGDRPVPEWLGHTIALETGEIAPIAYAPRQPIPSDDAETTDPNEMPR